MVDSTAAGDRGVGGSTFGIEDDCTDCEARGDNLGAQLSRAGIAWRGYMEDMPGPCYEGAQHDGYVKRHNPFMYFPTVSADPGVCENVVPATQLDEDVDNGSLPAFSWLSPSLCHGGHDCDLAVADEWLSELVPRILSALGPSGVLVVTFDEGESDRGCCDGARGGHIATIFAGPGARRARRLSRPFDQYALLGAIEDRFGLPRLRNARGTPSLDGALRPVGS